MNLIKEEKYIDTMMFEVSAIYYIRVNDTKMREALIVCISRTSEKAEFLRVFDISGTWSNVNNYLTIEYTYTEEFDNIIIKKAFFGDVYNPVDMKHNIIVNLEK